MAVSAIGSTTSYSGINTAAWNSMTTLTLQRAQIQNGSYGKLMKAYVKKVGNKAALDAYRSTGSTTVSAASLNSGSSTETASAVTPQKKSVPRSSFLDNHLKSIGKTNPSRATAAGTSYLDRHLNSVDSGKTTGLERAVAYAEEKTGRAINAAGEFVDVADKYKTAAADAATAAGDGTAAVSATDRYAAMRSTWLDDHLKSYGSDAKHFTAANTSVAIDVAV